MGYDLKDKLLVVNDEEARLVRRIFEMYLTQKSTFAVAEELNRLGFHRKAYRTANGQVFGGKPFDVDSVIRVLQRSVYIGFVANKRTGQEFPGQHQPIVSKEVFEAAQNLLKAHNRRDGEASEGTNKHGFLLKGLIRCGACKSAVVGYVQIKKGKPYLYYKCIAKVNGLPVRCPFGSIGARKLEEYLIEKLAAVGYDRPLLERVVQKVKELAREQLGPLEEEKRQTLERLAPLEQKIRNLLGLVASDGVSEEARKELRRLEAVKSALEAQASELEAKIAHRKKGVYDVDVIQAALQRFGRMIYRIPVDLRVRTMRLLVKQVTVYKGRLQADLHELPIASLQRALDVRIAREPIKFESRRSLNRRDLNSKGQPGRQGTTLLEVGRNWRERREQKTTAEGRYPVPRGLETHFIPAFRLSWLITLTRIANGEIVIDEVVANSASGHPDPAEAQEAESSNPVVP